MSLANYMQIRLRATGPSGEELVNLLAYQQTAGLGTPTVGNMNTIADAFANAIVADYLNNISASCHWFDVEANYFPTGGPAIEGQSVLYAGQGGGSLGTSGNVERCIILKKKSGVIGRKNRGRIFTFCPCQEAFNNDGTFLPGFPDAGTLAVFITDLENPVSVTVGALTYQFSPVIFHRATSTSVPILTVQPADMVGIQRRRRLGIGA